MLPTDIFLIVFFLFQLKNMPNKELLQILICIIDTKLFETNDPKNN